MLPDRLSERAKFLQYLMFNYATLHPSYSKVFAVSKNFDAISDDKDNLMQALAHGISKNWTILNKHLEHRQYIVGDSPTIIDYLVTVYASWGNFLPELSIELGEHVMRLVSEISSLPEFKAAYALEEKEYKLPEKAEAL